jgi:predicted  nucleic acid-binding Zn-ribbon protein
MAISGSALRQLHRIHRQLTDLRERLARGPKQITAGETNVKRAENELATAKTDLRSARVAADDKQLQLKSREMRLKDLQAKLNQSQSNKEFQAIKEQMAADTQANSVLSDEILEALEHMDTLQVAIGVAEQNLTKAKEEVAKVRARVQEQQQGLENELARVLNELAQAEEQLPGDFKVEYLRLTKARGEDAMAVVDGDCCGGCFQMITANMEADLRMERPVFCKSCGRLLYLSEDTQPIRKRS